MWALGATALLVVLLAPLLFAGGLGRFVGGLWVTVMAAIAGLLGALFGH
jgi:hypothetical protein